KLDVDEFRGFVLSDPFAPAIFLNGSDAKAAQIFTLAHELAHIWIGASGISNPDYSLAAAELVNSTERHCNRIAAEVLLPQEDFQQRWDSLADVERNVRTLATYYRVSQIVVLRQARD